MQLFFYVFESWWWRCYASQPQVWHSGYLWIFAEVVLLECFERSWCCVGPSSNSTSKIRSGARPSLRPLRGERSAPLSCTLLRSLGSACSSSRLVSSGRGAGVRGAESASALPEARKSSDSSFSSLFVRCMSPSQRVARVSDSVTSLLTTPTRDMHINSCGSMHGSVMHDNSSGMHVSSCGALGHKNSCHVHAAEVRRGKKAPSTSTRLGVRCPAVEELALHSRHQEACMERYGPAYFKTRARRFSGRWKSFQGLQQLWPVLHVLIILLSHLGRQNN